MSRDQRVADNWALLYGLEQARERAAPLYVVFGLSSRFLDATARQYGFMLDGLREVEKRLLSLNVPFCVLPGPPDVTVPAFLDRLGASLLITDFDPLRIKRGWVEGVSTRIKAPLHQVDARNIVPVWTASTKQEFSARTFRPKIGKLLPRFLEPFPVPERHPFGPAGWPDPVDWKNVKKSVAADASIPAAAGLEPGEEAAFACMTRFINERLSRYEKDRNDPCLDGQSHLSPYLHFGQLASQRVALDVLASAVTGRGKDAFLEELVVRRELSDNYCFYNPFYDSPRGFPAWAVTSLQQHASDPRPVLYDRTELEHGETSDPAWNAAQMEMVQTGRMHGYLRMYWAKKLLEWSGSPGEAQEVAIWLNDKYQLDGRDSNGYAGIAWSIGGVHDRPWPERPVFGKIRYMGARGLFRKFDMKSYIARINDL